MDEVLLAFTVSIFSLAVIATVVVYIDRKNKRSR